MDDVVKVRVIDGPFSFWTLFYGCNRSYTARPKLAFHQADADDTKNDQNEEKHNKNALDGLKGVQKCGDYLL